MLQNIIYKISTARLSSYRNRKEKDDEYSRKKLLKMKRFVRGVDSNGNIVPRPLHRRDFEKIVPVSLVAEPENSQDRTRGTSFSVERYYYQDIDQFNEILAKYNNSKEQTISLLIRSKSFVDVENFEGNNKPVHQFKGYGPLNVRMKFCSRCGDANKSHKLEIYFVDQNEITNSRTVFCSGCIGMLLKYHEQNVKEFK